MSDTLLNIPSQQQTVDLVNAKYKPYECGCLRCISACYVSPCIPTPLEAKGLIESGFIEQMSINFYPDLSKQALRAWVGPKALDLIPGHMIGILQDVRPCAMMDLQTGKCKVHNSGFKPIEGRLGGCNIQRNDSYTMRSMVLDTWNSVEAFQVMDLYVKTKFSQETIAAQQEFFEFVKDSFIGKLSIFESVEKLKSFDLNFD